MNIPVFPNEYGVKQMQGITLRDYFAAQAMQGWLASFSLDQEPHPEKSAEFCFAMADAMMKAREL